ncbi:hypothetical protein Mgra_00006251 [Meloidogyne graminicola]|uniref:Mitochondrial carrier protein n=1 Tax=Meloidogyne graminicola TaxID=189291 RepID=A0A8S9ZMH2_9BILA|nr:hypothetical protein Mgra_00006251 [Meloidogyne graminicola]
MYKDFLAGYVAGSSGILFGYPLDTLKTRIQLNNNSSINYFKVAKGIFQKEGAFTFYRGMSAPFLTAGLINSLLFSGYTLTLKELQNNKTYNKRQGEFKAHESIKLNKGPLNCALLIIQKEGLIGLYKVIFKYFN